MNTWVPLFSKVVNSSLWDEDDATVKIFITMLVLKDSDHVVRHSAFAIAKMARKTEREVLDALKKLQSPDRKRIEPQPHEGRRVQKVEDGYQILNGEYYESLMRIVNRRAYKAAKEAEYRRRRKESKISAQAKESGKQAGAAQALQEGFEPERAAPAAPAAAPPEPGVTPQEQQRALAEAAGPPRDWNATPNHPTWTPPKQEIDPNSWPSNP